MGAIDISVFDLGKIFILLIPVYIINKLLKIEMNKSLFSAVLRMVVQLFLVGIFLEYIFFINSSLINFLYLVFMVIAAVFSVIKSTKLNITMFIKSISISFFLPLILVLSYFLIVVIKVPQVLDAQYVIPIGGMILGNSLRGIIVSLESFYNSIVENEKEYIYTLALSINKKEALRPYLKKAMIVSSNPTIASIETIGLVSLPGMMTGQILGGSVPITAIKYQIAIMISIFVAKYFSSFLAILMSSQEAFDEYDMIRNIYKKKA